MSNDCNKDFELFYKKKIILGFWQQKHVVVLALVVTWSLYTSLSRLQDVVVAVFVPVIHSHSQVILTMRANMFLAFVQTKEIYILAVTLTYN